MVVDGVARLVLLGELSERTIADIAREIESLRQENARLKEDVSRLEEELATQTPVRRRTDNGYMAIHPLPTGILACEEGKCSPQGGRKVPDAG